MSSVGSVQTAELSQFLDIYLASSRQRISALESDRDSLELRGSIYTDLRSKLTALRSLTEELAAAGDASVFASKITSSSTPTVLTATAGSVALAMSHIIHVDQLARSHQVVSDRITSSGTDIASSFAGTSAFIITTLSFKIVR